MSTIQEIIHEAKRQTLDCQLGQAIATMRRVYDQRPSLFGRETFEDIEQNHRLMLDYMLRGYADNERQHLYRKLLRRIYQLVADLEIAWRCKNNHVYVLAFQRADRLNLSPAFLQEVLERFVSDVAMLSLEDETTAEAKRNELYARHQTFIGRLFCSLVVSCQWSAEETDNFLRLILLPTIDQSDALVIVSAITLSATQQFDIRKTQLLAQVYQQATETDLRQRALVGFVLSLLPSRLFDEEQTALLQTLNSRNNFLNSLIEMQEQALYCLNADRDHEKIENDIMPTIVKNSPLRVTRFGIEEKETDALEDILHPDAEDKASEEVEKSVTRMFKMMQSGADIYFGGFKMMKRFPFFNELCNWFMPFNPHHPALAATYRRLEEIGILGILLDHGAMCESDKYSLVFAMTQIAEKLPPSMREMAGNREALGAVLDTPQDKADMRSRQFYLQDLYRFFCVHPMHAELRNPFGKDTAEQLSAPAFFTASPLFDCLDFDQTRLVIARFLRRQRMQPQLARLLSCFSLERAEYYQLRGLSLMDERRYEDAEQAFRRALGLEPENENRKPILKGLATTLMRRERYAEAQEVYAQLTETDPDNIAFAINQSIALLESEQTDKAVEILFRLNYLHPDDKSVMRVLAWGLLMQQKTPQAQRFYDLLLADEPTAEDMLNAGYAAWCEGKLSLAVERFSKYIKKMSNVAADEAIRQAFERDRRLLELYGKDDTEITLMAEAVAIG